jgi:hypothetical protein
MRALRRFARLDESFWAHVRLVSERLKYSKRSKKPKGAPEPKGMRRYTIDEITAVLESSRLDASRLRNPASGTPTELGKVLCDYLNFRAETIERKVEPNLMTREQARAEFERLRKEIQPRCALPLNKQKGKKRHHAFMCCIVNMLTERELGGRVFADEPRGLTVVSKNARLLRTFSRWMDGAYPDIVNPHAVWEVKEYYGTTTFGSRVADGVYETMLDGFEFAELERGTGLKVLHYLIVDDRFTWWDCGRSYLCRIVDMLHRGFVDEVLFGREVLNRWPEIVRSWP